MRRDEKVKRTSSAASNSGKLILPPNCEKQLSPLRTNNSPSCLGPSKGHSSESSIHRSSSSVFKESAAPHLVSGQNLEGGHDLVGRVRVGRLPGHEVDKGLEGDDAHPVGIHNAHDAGELILPLVVRKGKCKAKTLAKAALTTH